ncbi:nucleoporin Nup43-like [Dendronephthya gigantea]|uniref:nucleoporin Nup43-like n=1 Tax=Dendronephthya gigantea TaxID=151771 RepID=UPI001069F39C|nr:nucleoporin Nup43-like [Dendronephthya gigantea]
MATSATVHYVGQKVSKVRWRPSTHLKRSTVFASGGWDNNVNNLCLWSTEDLQSDGNAMSIDSNLADEPQLICAVEHEGSVTDIKYTDSERILTASSNGNVTLHKHDSARGSLSQFHSWHGIHHYNETSSCSCTSLATNTNLPDFVSVGEDGRIVVLRMDHQKPVRNIESADCTTISAVTFVKSYEIATVNFIGQLKVWDLRQKEVKPVRAMLLSGDRVPLLCIDKHPTQPHLIVTGGQDGVLGLWDMRQERYPVTLLEAHSAEIWEVKFYTSNPDHLFTCSQDGAVWQWNGSSMKTPSLNISRILKPNAPDVEDGVDSSNTPTPWLSADASKHKIETFSLLPYNRSAVNSLDVTGQNLVCGTDGEAVYVLENLDLDA